MAGNRLQVSEAKTRRCSIALSMFAIRDETRKKVEGASRADCPIVDRRPPSRVALSRIDSSGLCFCWDLAHGVFSV